MKFTTIKNRVFILAFWGILVIPWIAGGAMQMIAPNIYEQLSIVKTEKRVLQEIEWGNLLNTGESVSSYVDDRIPFRYTMISWYRNLNDILDENYQIIANSIGEKVYSANADVKSLVVDIDSNVQTIAFAAIENKVVDTPEEVDDSNYYQLVTYQDVIIAREGWLFLYGENEIECYQGTNILSDEEMAAYAAKLNQLQSICNARGKQLYVYIAPNKSQVYSQYMPTVEIVNTYKREQRLHSYIAENCTTPYLYPLTESLAAANNYQTYYKYDSHWNHLGALYGTNALYAAMGVEQTEPSQWIVGTEDAEKYELYTYMGIPDEMVTHNDSEYVLDYRPDITVNGLNTEAMVCRTTSNGANDSKLCVIGDSFRVNMMPYLAKDFTRCTFCHRDYMSEIKSDINSADIIVIEAVERYDYEAFNTIQRTINILSQ